jgi:PAS domain S-box-containing protein
VFAVLAAASVAGFFVTRGVVEDQERRLLSRSTAEIGAVLETGVARIESSLRVIGPLGASSDPAARSLFAEAGEELVEVNRGALGVARVAGDAYTVTAAVGVGPAVGEPLTGTRAAVAGRALETGELVGGLVADGAPTKLILARPVDPSAVAFQEVIVDPTRPTPSTPDSPFHGLKVALYAAPDIDPARLVLTTEAEVPLAGRVERVPFAVGADQWLLAAGAREPLVGSFASNMPLVLLGGGLLTALLASAVVETVARRRSYAVALVEERTGELQQALGELGETRSFLERLLTAGPTVVSRVSVPDRATSYVSPNVERLFGVDEREARQAGFVERLVHPEDRPSVDNAVERVAARASVREHVEYRLVPDHDSARWVSAVLVPETDDDDRVEAVLSYAVDIDDRRRAEQAQREAQDDAEAANRAKSEFLSRMSHELRTPLNAVLGFAQLLELDDLTGSQREALAHILKGGHHLLDLINEVLDISRIEAGGLALSPEAVHVRELVQETVDLIRPLAEQQHIRIVVDRTAASDGYVFADRQRVKQILLNLLSNAVKYNRPRGTVAVSCEEPDTTHLRIAVVDTGAGIPTERMELLFTPFERLGAEHTAVEGTGIGLALSQRLAQAMGGTLSATSTLGQGSTFTVELPRVEGPVERYERLNGNAPPSEPEVEERARVVLYIEDNLSNVKLVERVLGHRPDVKVVAAMQGRLGLELARDLSPVLVLLDLHLPDMGGEQVLQRLRDDASTAATPVVIVSADATPGQVQRLLTAGATAYLTKPIDVRRLLRLLDQTLEVA